MENNKGLRVGIYSRVSTADKKQDPEVQLTPLREFCKARDWSIVEEYVDKVSGAKDRRPALDRLMNDAKKRKIDVIVVWKLDRWGRSLKHLINSLSELQALGVSFVSYSENIDLTTPAGRMMFHVIGAMAEFERSLIIERVKAGMAIARLRGIKIGRQPLPPADIVRVLDAHENKKLTIREIARETGIPRSTVFRVVKQFKEGLIDRAGMAVKAVA